jgi:hypothetical protein
MPWFIFDWDCSHLIALCRAGSADFHISPNITTTELLWECCTCCPSQGAPTCALQVVELSQDAKAYHVWMVAGPSCGTPSTALGPITPHSASWASYPYLIGTPAALVATGSHSFLMLEGSTSPVLRLIQLPVYYYGMGSTGLNVPQYPGQCRAAGGPWVWSL